MSDIKNNNVYGESFWQDCLFQLQEQIPHLQWKTWLKPLVWKAHPEKLNTFLLIAPNGTFSNQVKKNYLEKIQILAEKFSIEIVLTYQAPTSQPHLPSRNANPIQSVKKVEINNHEKNKLNEISSETNTAVKKRQIKKVKIISPPSDNNIIQLPVCPEGKQPVPHPLLRSALFAAIQGQKRKYIDNALIVSIEGIEIHFKGEQLDQTDLDVWQQTINLMKGQALGSKCRFNANHFLQALGRNAGGKEYEWLKSTFLRLASSLVDIKVGDISYFGTLIEGGMRNEKTKEYEIRLSPELSKLFDAGWTQIAFEDRQKLKRKPLAQWLHSMYSSHLQPYPMKVETIHRLSGSTNKDLHDFQKNKIPKALEDLQKIGFLKEWWITDDLVYVKRSLTDNQKRLLTKQKTQDNIV